MDVYVNDFHCSGIALRTHVFIALQNSGYLRVTSEILDPCADPTTPKVSLLTDLFPFGMTFFLLTFLRNPHFRRISSIQLSSACASDVSDANAALANAVASSLLSSSIVSAVAIWSIFSFFVSVYYGNLCAGHLSLLFGLSGLAHIALLPVLVVVTTWLAPGHLFFG